MKLPIAIISTMRSGSTALLWEYYERLIPITDSITILNEPKVILPTTKEYIDNLIIKSDIYTVQEFTSQFQNKNLIVKAHAYDIINYWQYLKNYVFNKFKSNNFYVVRIRRRNLVEQSISAYIAILKKNWNPNKELKAIPIRYGLLKFTVNMVKKYNDSCDNFDYSFNEDLFYEDLNLATKRITKSIKVENYDKLYSLTKQVIISLK